MSEINQHLAGLLAARFGVPDELALVGHVVPDAGGASVPALLAWFEDGERPFAVLVHDGPRWGPAAPAETVARVWRPEDASAVTLTAREGDSAARGTWRLRVGPDPGDALALWAPTAEADDLVRRACGLPALVQALSS